MTFEEYVNKNVKHLLTDEELEELRIQSLNKKLSTDIITADILNNKLTVNLPKEVIEFINKELKRIESIFEFRNSPKYDGRFPAQGTKIHNVWKFINSINEVENKYLFEYLDTSTSHALDMDIRYLCDKLLNDDFYFLDYI